MSTKLTDELYLSKEEVIDTYEEILQRVFEEVETMVKKRWVKMENKNVFYDNEVAALFPKFSDFNNFQLYNNTSEKEINKAIKDHFGNGLKWEIIEWEEKIRSIHIGIKFPFKGISNGRINYINNNDDYRSLVKKSNGINYHDLDGSSLGSGTGTPIAICRLNGVNSKAVSSEKAFKLFLKNDLIPLGLKNKEEYKMLLNISSINNEAFEIKNGIIKISDKITKEEVRELSSNLKISSEEIKKSLLEEDKERADILKYPSKIINDINEGHWSLWEPLNKENYFKVQLTEKFVARNPKSSIVDGIVGIDFGTKNTVVAYQKDSIHTMPMRVGTGDLSKEVEKKHYENPTIMEFEDLLKFIMDYRGKSGRPYTNWQNIRVSHSAFNNLKQSLSSKDYGAYLNELKQWAGNKEKRLKIVDKTGYMKDLKPYLELDENEFDPIEIYAYYLGLYINNMHNGIYMNYSLSFPVTYELEIRDKIIESFSNGLRKSLPESLLEQKDVMEKFKVEMGASEPAAYAITALTKYEFKPEDDEKVFYGIFDFGGGTTDFDFGIWREAQGAKERRYDYVIEHFGAGGDRYLGGENLLELLAFEVFKKNVENGLREKEIPFTLPPECREFTGSEVLLSNSREASLNTKNLMEKLRPFWEGEETYEEGLKVDLYNKNEELVQRHPLTVDIEELKSILENRINKGVINFFESLRMAFSNSKIKDINKVNIFLAGNSSKSPIVLDLFQKAIEKEVESSIDSSLKKEFFEIFPALGTKESFEKMNEREIKFDENDMEAPTGKTGVAFGLIESRKGGDILVIDENIVDENIKFKYYLGESRKKQFRVIINREKKYGEWVEFIDAGEDKFELYYTDQPMASTNKMNIADESIRLKRLDIDFVDEDAMVYVRLVSPSVVEYVVALEEEIKAEKYLGKVQQIQLN
ncbi:hypothetical protein ACQ9ZF_03650 [Cetobacterium somerae]|uniref:hypothetical protein n=1 Tax=Cetobacterium somerae TaxID=188913 RepID=UPI003D768F21